MIEKVNPSHPDKIADRIAGALVDLCYTKSKNPKCAFEVLIGHGWCFVIGEVSHQPTKKEVMDIVERLAGKVHLVYQGVPQDYELSKNQLGKIRCGDNGIFKGVPVRAEVRKLSDIVRELYEHYPSDGKYILDGFKLIACQSNTTLGFKSMLDYWQLQAIVNPLGDWTGGTDVDTGAVNRKLGSDMGDAVTGGGLHGKDLSKADVSINIYAHLKAQETGEVVELSCAIGDSHVDGKPYEEIVAIAKEYIDNLGGFEKLAEWGLV